VSGQLKEGLTIVDVVSIGVGSAVGVSIFSIMAPAAKVAGAGMLPALALASIPMIIFAVVYAFMGSTVPKSGASFEWPARFIHPFVGFMVACLRAVGNTGALTVLTLVLGATEVGEQIRNGTAVIAKGLAAAVLTSTRCISPSRAFSSRCAATVCCRMSSRASTRGGRRRTSPSSRYFCWAFVG
jgi:amino acid transporter